MQLQAFGKWLDEEEGKQAKVAAHEEPVLQSSTISARVVQLRNAFEKLNKKKKPVPPPAPKQQANMTGDAFLSFCGIAGLNGLVRLACGLLTGPFCHQLCLFPDIFCQKRCLFAMSLTAVLAQKLSCGQACLGYLTSQYCLESAAADTVVKGLTSQYCLESAAADTVVKGFLCDVL